MVLGDIYIMKIKCTLTLFEAVNYAHIFTVLTHKRKSICTLLSEELHPKRIGGHDQF